MAKKRPTEASSNAPPHCWNCGQKVKGERAERARSLGIVYCPWCGFMLSQEDTCQNNNCDHFGQRPNIS